MNKEGDDWQPEGDKEARQFVACQLLEDEPVVTITEDEHQEGKSEYKSAAIRFQMPGNTRGSAYVGWMLGGRKGINLDWIEVHVCDGKMDGITPSEAQWAPEFVPYNI